MKFKLILAVILLGHMGHVYACKCAGPGTVKESFKKVDGVIHGVVINIGFVSFAETITTAGGNWIYGKISADKKKMDMFEYKGIIKIELRVLEKYKGNIAGDTVTIYTTEGGGSCGYDFEMGKEYIAYGYTKSSTFLPYFLNELDQLRPIEKESTFWTNRCMRTTEYNKLEADELKEQKRTSG